MGNYTSSKTHQAKYLVFIGKTATYNQPSATVYLNVDDGWSFFDEECVLQRIAQETIEGQTESYVAYATKLDDIYFNSTVRIYVGHTTANHQLETVFGLVQADANREVKLTLNQLNKADRTVANKISYLQFKTEGLNPISEELNKHQKLLSASSGDYICLLAYQ